MIGIDTNVVLRFITADDPGQSPQARRLLETTSCFVADTVVLECGWVLESIYGFSREEVVRGLRSVLGLDTVQVESPQRLQQALRWYLEGLDFADALHLSTCQHLTRLATFDAPFREGAAGRGTCAVVAPDEALDL